MVVRAGVAADVGACCDPSQHPTPRDYWQCNVRLFFGCCCCCCWPSSVSKLNTEGKERHVMTLIPTETGSCRSVDNKEGCYSKFMETTFPAFRIRYCGFKRRNHLQKCLGAVAAHMYNQAWRFTTFLPIARMTRGHDLNITITAVMLWDLDVYPSSCIYFTGYESHGLQMLVLCLPGVCIAKSYFLRVLHLKRFLRNKLPRSNTRWYTAPHYDANL